MQIKSSVLPEDSRPAPGGRPGVDREAVKEEVLAECRKLVLEILREERER